MKESLATALQQSQAAQAQACDANARVEDLTSNVRELERFKVCLDLSWSTDIRTQLSRC